MPILKRENDIYPADLLSNMPLLSNGQRRWMCIYTMSRREKDLMRKLSWKQEIHVESERGLFKDTKGSWSGEMGKLAF